MIRENSSLEISVRLAFLLLALSFLPGCNDSDGDGLGHAATGSADTGDWVGAWATAPYGPYPLGPLSVILPVDVGPLPPVPVFPGNQASNQSFRMIVHPTLGGERLRLRFSNLIGDRPVIFGAVRVAKSLGATGPLIIPGTDHVVTFGGDTRVVIPKGKEIISDAVELPVSFGDDLAVSFFVEGDSGPMTWHAISFSPSWVSLIGTGDVTTDATGLLFTQPTIGWYFISGVDVEAPDSPGSIVALGDSITDGAFEVPATNTRWPDLLATRLHGAGINMGVLNEGINSNTVTRVADGAYGPPALDRFDRDVLRRAGVRSVIILEGTNDLTQGPATAEEVYAGLTELAGRAHAAGLCVVGATIMPRADAVPVLYGWDIATMEPQREKLNELIRGSHAFDALADFDTVMRNPLLPALPFTPYYFADQLHPNTLGFLVMANAVPIEALVPPPLGNCDR